MGNKLFDNYGVDISKTIAKKLGKSLLPTILKTITVDSPSPANNFTPTETPVNYDCRGFVDSFPDEVIDGTRIETNDRKIVILGDTINSGNTAPKVNDKINIEGKDWVIVNIKRDPDRATYECQGR